MPASAAERVAVGEVCHFSPGGDRETSAYPGKVDTGFRNKDMRKCKSLARRRASGLRGAGLARQAKPRELHDQRRPEVPLRV